MVGETPQNVLKGSFFQLASPSSVWDVWVEFVEECGGAVPSGLDFVSIFLYVTFTDLCIFR